MASSPPPRAGAASPSRWRRPDPVHQRSRSAPLPPVAPPPAATSLAGSLLEAATLLERERLGTALLGVLNDAFRLPPCRLVVADRPQLHATDEGGRLTRRTYGTYRCRLSRPGDPPGGCVIRIYHLTAIRRQVLRPRPFLDTLLHEWVHHLDFAGLRFDRSPHTSGFYHRLQAVGDALGVGSSPSPAPRPRSQGSPGATARRRGRGAE
ncbi:MAG TPA: hypothetical protein VMW47_00540 [Verrucomicrobiae bacterium]|nr:hypothetical protein [Verrucomicrobiae bacterium]